MPELFGLYSLALGTIVLVAGFSDFGLGMAMITFVSKALGNQDQKKAKAYFSKLIRFKFLIVALATIVLLGSAYFIANNYYNKPIFYALLAGGLYIPFASMAGFFEGIFRSTNKFKFILIKEIVYQALRFSIIPLSILFLMKRGLNNSTVIAGIILALSFCFFVMLIFLFILYKKKIKFSKEKRSELSLGETRSLKRFILPLTFSILSGIFFGYIDTIMLGHFVTGEFIGYYSAAFTLVASAVTIISFAAGGLFPLFVRLKGKELEKGFLKTKNMILLISVLAGIFTLLFAKHILFVVYGVNYLPSVLILQIFSIFVLVGPMIALYDTYFTSQERTKIIAILLIITTVVNVILNYFFITYGLKFGMFEALIGACVATLISRIAYLVGLIVLRKRKEN